MRTSIPWALPTEPTPIAALRAAGVTEKMIRTQLAAGALVRLRRGVYLAARPMDPAAQHALIARAELTLHPEAVLSHASAALHWGLPYPGFGEWADQPISVCLPGGLRHRSRSGPVVHHLGPLPASAVARTSDGYPITSVARTAVDLARALPLPQSLVLLDAASRLLIEGFRATVRRSDYVNARLVEAARAQLLHASEVLGAVGIRTAIDLANPARESAAESLSAGHFELAGLPRPQFQASIQTDAGTFFPDCLWLEQGVVGECDGLIKYADPEAFGREKQREQAIRDAGFVVVRWLAKEIMGHPQTVVDRVGRALGC